MNSKVTFKKIQKHWKEFCFIYFPKHAFETANKQTNRFFNQYQIWKKNPRKPLYHNHMPILSTFYHGYCKDQRIAEVIILCYSMLRHNALWEGIHVFPFDTMWRNPAFEVQNHVYKMLISHSDVVLTLYILY